MATNFGFFSQSPYISDPYVKPKVVDSKLKGKQIISTVANSSLFDKEVRRLYAGEPYVTFEELERQKWKKRNTEDPLKRTGFRYASGPKKMATAGGLEGTFTSRVEHIPEYEVLTKGDPRVRDVVPPPEKRGFYTSPGKKALPGTADKVTGSIDTRPVDPYVTAAEVEREVQKERRKKALAGAFKAGHAPELPPPVDTLPIIASPKPSPPKHSKPIATKPFLPASPRGITEPLDKITYEPIPYDHALVSARKLREEAKKLNISPRAFVPVSGPKSAPVKSLGKKLQPLYRLRV